MHARRCQGCGAPLPEGTEPSALRCRFCGLVHDPIQKPASDRVAQVHIHAPGLQATARRVATIFALAMAATVAVGIFGLYVGFRTVNTAVGSSALSSATAKPTKLVPAQLAQAEAGIHDLDVAPPAGGYAAVDAVATLPWALTVAQSWAKDARIQRIDVTRMRPDGTVNVQDDPEGLIRYRLHSPSQLQALREHAELTADTRGKIELFIVLQGGQVKGQVIETTASSSRRVEVAPHPKVLPLAKLVSAAPVERTIAGAPFLNGYLIHLEREGWVWYFSTLGGDSKPRVRATDGAVWPYSGPGL